MLNLTTNASWSGVDIPASSTSGSSWRALLALVPAVALLAAVILQLGEDGGSSTVAGVEQPSQFIAEPLHSGPPTGSAPAAPVTTQTLASEGSRSFAWHPVRASEDVYLDPRSVTRRFATDFLGMATPSLGGYQPTDEASGLVAVRAEIGGPATSVLLHRNPANGRWSVVGASSEHIVIEQPELNGAVGDPLHVSGRAITGAGLVGLELWADGDREPLLVREFVIRAGEDPDWFEGSFGWTASRGSRIGAVVFRIFDPDTGAVSEGAVVPVVFSPGRP